MVFDRAEASACPINEMQIAVVGGVNNNGTLMDHIELYHVRENAWKLYEVGMSSPRKGMCTQSSQKDRLMIIGGVEQSGLATQLVEEIDFCKRNLVSLPSLKRPRVHCVGFTVNDAIYVFGGESIQS